ncbi:MAG: hypothetical protein ACREJO_13040 [Phycisphaerales bacterium]
MDAVNDPIDAAPAEPLATPAHPNLTSYLADHDAPCPHCRYNLRGVSGSTCPECGKSIELALSAPSRFGGRGLFLLAAFLIVLIGGSIAATRQWRDVRTTASGSFLLGGTPLRISATSNSVTLLSSSGRVTTTPIASGTVTLTAPTITVNGISAAATPSTPARAPRATTSRLATGASPLTSLTAFAPFAPITPGPAAWSTVTIGQWSMLGLWSLLALAALAALLLLMAFRLRKHAPGPRWLRTLSFAGISLLALFGAAHITLFITDMLR